jgi:hypothetical protein
MLKDKLLIFLINTLLLYIPLLALMDGRNHGGRNELILVGLGNLRFLQVQQYIASLCSWFIWVGTHHYQPPLTNLHYLPKNSRATLPKNSQPTRYPVQKLTQKLTTHNGLVGGGTKKLCQHREHCRTTLQ